MSAAKHTPGPWEMEKAPGAVWSDMFDIYPTGVEDSEPIAVDCSRANATLIAAAPETAEKAMRFTMLVERYLQDGIDDGEPAPDLSEVAAEMYALRAHIAKALGSAA